MNRWLFATTLTIGTTLSLVGCEAANDASNDVRSIATVQPDLPSPACLLDPADATEHLITGWSDVATSGTGYAAPSRHCSLFTVDFIVDDPQHTFGPVDFHWGPTNNVPQSACTDTQLEMTLWGFPLDGSGAVKVKSDFPTGQWDATSQYCQLGAGTVRIGSLGAAPAKGHPPFPYGHLRLAVGASTKNQTLSVQSDATGI
jgi:hypothetical protein